MNTHIIQYALVVLLVLTLAALTDPFMYWMPSMPQMLTLTLACVSLIAWIGFVLRETALDEREEKHRMFAGRVAYLTGVGVLAIALFVQGLSHTIDVWVTMALALMVVSKIVARWYADSFW